MNKIYIDVEGGLGDIVLTTPIFKALKEQHGECKLIAVYKSTGHRQVLENNPFIDRYLKKNLFIKALQYFNLIKLRSILYAYLKPSYTYTKKAQEIIADVVGVKLTDINTQIYLKDHEDSHAKKFLTMYSNPIVIHITSITSDDQMWPVENWNELVKSMPDYTFIQLGTPMEERIEGTIDLRGKTNVRESMALVKHAESFVGVVSFLSHVTNSFNKPGVVFFGPSSVNVWGHSNNINIAKNLPCGPCVDYLMHSKCPYNKRCMRTISVSEVQQAIYLQFPLVDVNIISRV